MTLNRTWTAYQPGYRAEEVKKIAAWISSGESGSVVGLPGCGRSNLLGFMCNRPEVVQHHLGPPFRPVALIAVDLNNLPANNLATLYRVILRAFYWAREQFEPGLQQKIATLYQKNEAQRDPFLPQSALQELLLHFESEQIQVVLVINRFDYFCRFATPRMTNTLRGLRDDFKNTLSYIAGMTREVAYLPDPACLGHMYELLDRYICWVGAMNERDARQMITEETVTGGPVDDTGLQAMLALTGGFPALLKAVCHWWLTTNPRPAPDTWATPLLAERSIQYRLARIWQSLTQEEQFIIAGLQKAAVAGQAGPNFDPAQTRLLDRLVEKGVCRPQDGRWQLTSSLLGAYVAGVKGRGRGRIWRDATSGDIYQGQTLLASLTDLERVLLAFLIDHPHQRHPKTALIDNVWPDELRQQGVSDNSLYQLIFSVRRTIEIDPSQPLYLVNWRGKPEGGYQFFPEGRPG